MALGIPEPFRKNWGQFQEILVKISSHQNSFAGAYTVYTTFLRWCSVVVQASRHPSLPSWWPTFTWLFSHKNMTAFEEERMRVKFGDRYLVCIFVPSPRKLTILPLNIPLWTTILHETIVSYMSISIRTGAVKDMIIWLLTPFLCLNRGHYMTNLNNARGKFPK